MKDCCKYIQLSTLVSERMSTSEICTKHGRTINHNICNHYIIVIKQYLLLLKSVLYMEQDVWYQYATMKNTESYSSTFQVHGNGVDSVQNGNVLICESLFLTYFNMIGILEYWFINGLKVDHILSQTDNFLVSGNLQCPVIWCIFYKTEMKVDEIYW